MEDRAAHTMQVFYMIATLQIDVTAEVAIIYNGKRKVINIMSLRRYRTAIS